MVTLPRSSVMTEGLGIETLPIRLEPSGRICAAPERIRIEVMLRPERRLRPGCVLVEDRMECRECVGTFHGDDFVVVDVHAGQALEVDLRLSIEMHLECLGA